MAGLGYPAYLATLIGVWKLLNGLAILAPRLPLLKEWAYAGVFFNMSGAVVSHLAVGDPATTVVTPLVLIVLAVISWALRPVFRRLPGTVR